MRLSLRLWEAVSSNSYFKYISLIAFLLGILVLAFCIRLQGRERIPDGQFTSNDAYLYYWQAQNISEHGHLPPVDERRWIPNGRDNTQLLSLYAYVLAYTHKAITLFFYDVSLYQVCLYLSIISFVIGLGILTVFLIKTYDLGFATIVAILLATLPGTIDRSTIGFSDRDAWCWMIGILAITTYLWKEQMQHGKQRWIATAIAGFTVFLGGLSWEGFGFFLIVIMSVELWKFCTTDAEDNLKEYILWILMFVPWLFLISPAYRSGYRYSTYIGTLMLVPPLVILALKSIKYLCLRFVTELQPHSRKFTWGLTLISISIGVIYILLQYKTFAVTAFPFKENRLMQIIGELADPDLRYWVGRYGSIFVLGSIGFIAASLQHWKWNAFTLAFALLLLSAAVFLHHPITHWIGHNSANLLFVASLPLTAIGISIAATRKQTSKNELALLATLVWFILWVSLSRNGKRYDFFIGVPLALGTAFLMRYITASFNVNLKFGGRTLHPKLITALFTTAMLTLLLFWNPVGGHATRSLHIAKKQNIYPENQNIMHAYKWIKTQLQPDKTIMAAQWDYGTQLNVHSNVKTITDPDHYLPHWVHLYYRHVYCAQSETEALYFLKTHNATHLMLTSADFISRAGKNSFVGSDLSFDRHFNLYPLLYLPTAPGTQYALAPQRQPIDTFTPNTDLTFIEIKGTSTEKLTAIAHFKNEETEQIPYVAFHGSKRILSEQTDKTKKGGMLLKFDTKGILRNAFYVPKSDGIVSHLNSLYAVNTPKYLKTSIPTIQKKKIDRQTYKYGK
ncbi:hypothetical protein J4G08_11465 [Candidatus Poribacteria bacterium]|nr:hypothetical protein [Candidatus Poribacteria bacterium]